MKSSLKCEICEKTFSTRQNKNRHVRIVHRRFKIHPQEIKRNFKCASCENSYTRSENLKTHHDSPWRPNVDLVENSSLHQELWKNTPTHQLDKKNYTEHSNKILRWNLLYTEHTNTSTGQKNTPTHQLDTKKLCWTKLTMEYFIRSKHSNIRTGHKIKYE